MKSEVQFDLQGSKEAAVTSEVKNNPLQYLLISAIGLYEIHTLFKTSTRKTYFHFMKKHKASKSTDGVTALWGTASIPAVMFVLHVLYLYLNDPISTEPVGSSKPQLSGDQSLKALSRTLSQTLDITCPAQGSPTPSFRY